MSVGCSVVGLAAEVRLCRTISQRTQGFSFTLLARLLFFSLLHHLSFSLAFASPPSPSPPPPLQCLPSPPPSPTSSSPPSPPFLITLPPPPPLHCLPPPHTHTLHRSTPSPFRDLQCDNRRVSLQRRHATALQTTPCQGTYHSWPRGPCTVYS